MLGICHFLKSRDAGLNNLWYAIAQRMLWNIGQSFEWGLVCIVSSVVCHLEVTISFSVIHMMKPFRSIHSVNSSSLSQYMQFSFTNMHIRPDFYLLLVPKSHKVGEIGHKNGPKYSVCS